MTPLPNVALSGGAVVIRERRPEDLVACVRVLRAVHLVDRYPMIWMAEPGRWLEVAGAVGAWVAEVDGEVVGHVTVRVVPADELLAQVRSVVGDSGVMEVNRLFVHPSCRGAGIGSALMRVAVRRAAGAPVVVEAVAGDGSVGVYERWGWREVARQRVEWPALPQRVVELVWFVAPAVVEGS